MLVVPVQPRFLVEPFVGAGVAVINEGKTEGANRVTIAANTMPAIRYGIGLATPFALFHMNLDLRIQYQATVFFPDVLTYIDAQGTRFTRDVATVSTSSLLVGIGIRVPY